MPAHGRNLPLTWIRPSVPDALRLPANDRDLNRLEGVYACAQQGPDTLVGVRRRQRGGEQYEKVGEEARFHTVREGRYRFLVNFDDYLDTGLFLDHRLTRRRSGELAAGRSFLNLFAYTGTATVHAVGGGATSSTTVDSP